MHRCQLHVLAIAVLVAVGASAPMPAQAGPTSDNLLELAARGGPALGLGVGVSARSPWALLSPPPATPGASAVDEGTLPTLEPRGRAVSLDVKLRWPAATEPAMGFEPYATLGPALVVNSPHEPYSLFGTPGDPVLRMGAKLGAGFNWRLNKATTLFGSYDLTTTSVDGLPTGAKAPAGGAATNYDALYGIRFRY